MFQVIKRSFWTVGKGKEVGYVEHIGERGLLIYNKCMGFRPTTTNLGGKSVHIVSLEKLPTDKFPTLQMAFEKRLPITVTFKNEIFSSPFDGDILLESFVTDVQIDKMVPDAVIHRSH